MARDLDELRGWLLGLGIVLAVGLWVALTAAVVVSIYAREAVLDAIGLPATVALVVLYQIPLIGAYLYADRIRIVLRDRLA